MKSLNLSPLIGLPLTLNGELESFSPLEIVGLVHETGKSGQLHVTENMVEKNVFFQEGEIIFASSNLEQDRLGESLLRTGRLTQEQFEKSSQLLKENSKMKLGKILVDQGFLTPGKLWVGVKNQVEEIFYTVLKMKKGHFSFYEGKPRLENQVRLSRSVRALIFEGVRQREELKIFVEKIISAKTTFLPLNVPVDLKLTDVENKIYRLIDGQKTVHNILTESTSSAFVTLKVLSNLMLGQVIVPKEMLGVGVPTPDEPDISTFSKMESSPGTEEKLESIESLTREKLETSQEIVSRYNKTFVEIHRTLEDFGFSIQQDLEEYFSSPDSPFASLLLKLEWQPEGGIHQDLILERVENIEEDQQFDFLNRAFEDLLFYLLFKTQEFLPKNVSEALLKTVEEIQGAESAE